jgi:hypothetical protein
MPFPKPSENSLSGPYVRKYKKIGKIEAKVGLELKTHPS